MNKLVAAYKRGRIVPEKHEEMISASLEQTKAAQSSDGYLKRTSQL